MIDQLKPLIGKLASFAQQRMMFARPPSLFLKKDNKNADMPLGKTAYYDPNQESITLFIVNRHPKDILRSFAHELVHHTQNLRGDLSPEKMGFMGSNYAQDNEHMRNMEIEAYLQGNMCFRDWEDGLSDEDTKKYKIAESKFLKESKTMTTKITKEFLKETIRKIVQEQIGIPEKDIRVVARRVISSLERGRKDFPASYVKGIQLRLLKLNTDESDQLVQALAKSAVGNVRGAEGVDISQNAKKAVAQMVARNKAAASPESKFARGFKAASDVGGVTGTVKEGSCGGKRKDKELEENEELEEAAKKMVKHPKTGKMVPDYVVDGEGEKDEANESKIQTPEQENTLYEQRFTPKNNRLFEKLVKEWTK